MILTGLHHIHTAKQAKSRFEFFYAGPRIQCIMMTSSNGNIFRVTLYEGIHRSPVNSPHKGQWCGALMFSLICAKINPLCGEFTDEFPSQRPVTRCFDVFFDLRLNKRLSKQSWGWWFETPSCALWRHCNVIAFFVHSTSLVCPFFPL